MSKQWKWTLAAALFLALAVSGPRAENSGSETAGTAEAWAQPAPLYQSNLVSVRVDSDAQGNPVVTLASDGEFEFESFVLDGPDRLVLDLPGVVSRLDQYKYPVGWGGLNRVRAAQHRMEPWPVTRVVFDLEGPEGYRIKQTGTTVAVLFGEETAETASAEPELQPVAEEPVEVAMLTEAEEPEAEPEPQPAEPEALEAVEETVEPAPELLAQAEEPEAEPEPQPAEPVVAEAEPPAEADNRAVEPDLIDRLLKAPVLASPEPAPQAVEMGSGGVSTTFETRRIVTEEVNYKGRRVSFNLVDADIKQVFRLFHELSGLNFVLDPDVSGRVTIVLDEVPWDQALDLILKNNGLDKVYEGNVLRIATTQKLAQEAASRKQLKEAEELEVEPITLTRTLSYAKAEDVQRVIREGGILSMRGKVIVDERTNTMIISDVPKKVAPLDALISTLDAETPQVMIEARIVETSKSFTREFGISWGLTAAADAAHGTTTGLSFPHNASARYGLNLPGEFSTASTLGFAFSNVVDSFTLDLELNALEDEGRGRILSAPKIATQNNERAEIEQGVRIPIVNTTATEINVEFVSASLLLNVTPQITAEGTIVLDIVVENNSPDFNNTAAGIPSITTQRAQTKVLIPDGGTTVIGGIFTVQEGEAELGVPWFRKIPVFGWLFKNERITQENRELLIFITPKIVKLG